MIVVKTKMGKGQTFLNPHLIWSVAKYSEGGSTICVVGRDERLIVSETPEQVRDLIEKALLPQTSREQLRRWIVSSLHGRTITPEEAVLYESLIRWFFDMLEMQELNAELFQHLPEERQGG